MGRDLPKILMPTEEPGGLDARVYPHWKGAPTYTIVEVGSSGNVLNLEIAKLGSDELLINLVKTRGIEYVVVQSISTRALELLNRVGVRVLKTKSSTVRDAVKDFVEKRLCELRVECEPMK